MHAGVPRAQWRKSSYSQNEGECVEAARLGNVVGVRDSKNPGGPVLTFAPAAWRRFLAAIKHSR